MHRSQPRWRWAGMQLVLEQVEDAVVSGVAPAAQRTSIHVFAMHICCNVMSTAACPKFSPHQKKRQLSLAENTKLRCGTFLAATQFEVVVFGKMGPAG